MSTVEVVEGRDGKRHAAADGVKPGEIHEVVALVFYVVQDGIGGRIDRNLVMIASRGCNQAQLIVGILVEDKRGEAADPGCLVVDGLRHRSFETKIGSISGQAAVISKSFGVVANADLV